MKKVLALVPAALMLLSLCACGSSADAEKLVAGQDPALTAKTQG